MVLLPDGTEEGRRAFAFEYTTKVVVTHKDKLARRMVEIARVRKLTGDGAPWVTGRRTVEDGVFEEDPVTALKGIGDEKAKDLNGQGIFKVAHVATFEDNDIQTMAEIDGLSVGLLRQIHAEAKTVAPGKFN